MKTKEMDETITLRLPIGHLIVVWDLLSNRLPETPYKEKFSESELRAIWGLEDLCEDELGRQGLDSTSEEKWEDILDRARAFVQSIPVEFLE